MDATRWPRLQAALARDGLLSAAEIARELDVSQPTVSRLLAEAGSRIVRIGRARATRYALAREIGRAGSHWPLYRITAQGTAELLGELHALHREGVYFASSASRPAFLHGDFVTGLFPGLPWFLDDQRPQGFLGRAFGRRIAAEIGANPDVLLWKLDDVLLALLRHGGDAPGDLVIGESSLQHALQEVLKPTHALRIADRDRQYPKLAEAALHGEIFGSSAGGEQPKFALNLADGDDVVPVIVKFSERRTTPGAQRWADLLVCEHLAGVVLRESGVPAAASELLEADDRVFLQSTRFDRTSAHGRLGMVSLYALDLAHYGHGRIDWWRFALELEADGWLDADDARRLRLYGWFGALIANSDMHLANVALQLRDVRPLPLLPLYDMLPMAFRPAGSGEVIERHYELVMPTPAQRDDWQAAADLARSFWERVADEPRISSDFRSLANEARSSLERAIRRV
ncbi:MAG: type II toxin-antitoxin system HipA family toxin YjjJ [Gammaproteobacteria bacterium]